MSLIYFCLLCLVSTSMVMVYARPDDSEEDKCPLVNTVDGKLKLCLMTINEVERLCCVCNRGEKLTELCQEVPGGENDYQSTVCTPCESGTYIDEDAHNRTECYKDDLVCPPDRIYVSSTPSERPRCDCPDGTHSTKDDKCEVHNSCRSGYGVLVEGSYNRDTECELCPNGFVSTNDSPTERCTRKWNESIPVIVPGTKTTTPTLTTTSGDGIAMNSQNEFTYLVLFIIFLILAFFSILTNFVILCRYCIKKHRSKTCNSPPVPYDPTNNRNPVNIIERSPLLNTNNQDRDAEAGSSCSSQSNQSRNTNNDNSTSIDQERPLLNPDNQDRDAEAGSSCSQSNQSPESDALESTPQLSTHPLDGNDASRVNDEGDRRPMSYIDEDAASVLTSENENCGDEENRLFQAGVDANGTESIDGSSAGAAAAAPLVAAPDVLVQPDKSASVNSVHLQNGVSKTFPDPVSAHGSSRPLSNHASPPNHNGPSAAPCNPPRKSAEAKSKMKIVSLCLSKWMWQTHSIKMYREMSPRPDSEKNQCIADIRTRNLNAGEVFYELFCNLQNELADDFNPESIDEHLRKNGMTQFAEDVREAINGVTENNAVLEEK